MVTSIDLELLALGGLPVGEVDAATAARVTRINDLQAQKASLLAIPVSPGTLIDPARLAEEPSGTPAWIGRGGALALAVLAGFAIAIGLDRGDRCIRGASDVIEVAGPVLAMVPVARGGSAAAANTRSEAMRLLRLRLERATTGPLGRIVLVPPVTGPPVEDVAMALATELAGDGGAVLVRIDEQCTGPNLVDAAAGRITIEEVLQQGPAPGLRTTEMDLGGEESSLSVAEVLSQPEGRATPVVRGGPAAREAAAGLEAAVAT